MPERPVHTHAASAPHRAGDPGWPRAGLHPPISLTLRVRDADAARTRACLDALRRDIPTLRIMAVSRHRGSATLVLLATRADVDAMLRGIMAGMPAAEVGAIQPAQRAAVH